MKKNIGPIDRIIRILLAIVIGIILSMKIISGTWTIILLIADIILIVTSITRFCGLYTLLGINTAYKKKK